MKNGPMLTTMIMRWRVLTELCQRFPKMRFWPGYLSRSRTTRGCSVSRFLEHILDVFLICDLKKKVSVWTWSCLGTLLYEPKRNDWLKHLSAKTHFDFLWGSWRWWWYQERWHWLYWLLQPWHWRHEREIRDQVQESRRKKKLLGLWASWVGLTTCSSLVKVRILLRKLVNSKVWNIILSNNILWFKELKACIKLKLSDIEHFLN